MIKNLFYSILQKIRHPSVRMRGLSMIRPGTEIRITDGGKISIGKGVVSGKRVVFSSVGGELEIEDHVFFNRNDIIVCREKVHIGENSAFGPNVVIYDHDHQYSEKGYEGSLYKCSPIIIGKNCWIGSNVTILRGTQIGDGCIIGAGAVVRETIPPFSIVTSDRTLHIQPIEKQHGEKRRKSIDHDA